MNMIVKLVLTPDFAMIVIHQVHGHPLEEIFIMELTLEEMEHQLSNATTLMIYIKQR